MFFETDFKCFEFWGWSLLSSGLVWSTGLCCRYLIIPDRCTFANQQQSCAPFWKQDRDSRGNCHRVSIVCSMCEVMGFAVRETIMNHVFRTIAISDTRHSFLSRKSWLTFFSHWASNYAKKPEDVILFHFQRVFDVLSQSFTQCKIMSQTALTFISSGGFSSSWYSAS